MSLFNRKIKLIDTDLFNGFVDCHSHILPGVDDGLTNIDDALLTLQYYETLGVKRVILTPHIGAYFQSNVEYHLIQYSNLLEHYAGPIELKLAGEYMLDSGFEDHISKGLRPIYSNRVLVETSYAAAPANMDELLYKMASLSYTPIIAHPERYLYMSRRQYASLKNKGYEFQLNLMSLSGVYGKAVRNNAEYLLANDMYDLCGSDLHNLDIFKTSINKLSLTKTLIEKILSLNAF